LLLESFKLRELGEYGTIYYTEYGSYYKPKRKLMYELLNEQSIRKWCVIRLNVLALLSYPLHR